MGNTETKLNFRRAVVQLTSKTEPVDPNDEAFWNQFWCETSIQSMSDIFTLIPGAEVRALREEIPSNLATLCYKAVEKLVRSAESSSLSTVEEQNIVLNCARVLTRLLPYIFEDDEWRAFFWSKLPNDPASPSKSMAGKEDGEGMPLAYSLVNALTDLLFCPEFTVQSTKKGGPDRHEDLHSIDSCEYIWAPGVGFANNPPVNHQHDSNRVELLKLLLACFSETMYMPPYDEKASKPNKWILHFTSPENRHALPLFTSLINVVFGYNPISIGSSLVPYNHLLFSDSREPLVETALQLLIVVLDHDSASDEDRDDGDRSSSDEEKSEPDNLFMNYLSRIHRDEDLSFILKGFTRLLNNPLHQTYLPNSSKKVHFHQELLVLFWKFCEYNKRFMFYVLKSSEVLDILVPILFHLNDSRADQSRVGLMHIGVFILLLLSGERNFGVRLNKAFTASVPMDVPVFTGTHADLLIIVFHKIITTGHQRLQPLFDCLLTILVNVSPYLKTMSMVASTKLLHLLESFSTPWFLYAAPNHHHLVFFLLEIFNNIIQYQFDGNSNLVYTIIRKRVVFHQLANLPTDIDAISKTLAAAGAKRVIGSIPGQKRSTGSKPAAPVPKVKSDGEEEEKEIKDDVNPMSPPPMEGSRPALPAEPGTLKASLAATPKIDTMTEQESAHPSDGTLRELARLSASNGLAAGSSATGTLSPTSQNLLDPEMELGVHSGSIVQPPATPRGTLDEVETFRVEAGSEKKVSSSKREKMARPGVATVVRQGSVGSSNRIKAPLSRTGSSSSSGTVRSGSNWVPTQAWVTAWKQKLPLQTVMRLLQVLVPQVEKICIDKGLTDESEILRFLQHGTLVGLLPVPHPILIRKYQANAGTTNWFRTYIWGIIYLRNTDPPIWYDTEVKLFEIQRI